MRLYPTLFAFLVLLCSPCLAASGHAHNDYQHARPLLDALDHGFTSVEADIWLRDGELLIGHDERHLDPARTLESLYLGPLQARVEANNGSVYGNGEPFLLLIDIKSEGEATYARLAEVLKGFALILAHTEAGSVVPGAVTAIVSGNRAPATMKAQTQRHAFYDGRLSDLEGGPPASFMPLVSDNWTRHFSWKGIGEMPADERAKLDEIVAAAHGKGYALRFWETPDQPGPARDALWRVLSEAGVDLINTDDLAGLAAFLAADHLTNR
jgi:hypothetical protein